MADSRDDYMREIAEQLARDLQRDGKKGNDGKDVRVVVIPTNAGGKGKSNDRIH